MSVKAISRSPPTASSITSKPLQNLDNLGPPSAPVRTAPLEIRINSIASVYKGSRSFSTEPTKSESEKRVTFQVALPKSQSTRRRRRPAAANSTLGGEALAVTSHTAAYSDRNSAACRRSVTEDSSLRCSSCGDTACVSVSVRPPKRWQTTCSDSALQVSRPSQPELEQLNQKEEKTKAWCPACEILSSRLSLSPKMAPSLTDTSEPNRAKNKERNVDVPTVAKRDVSRFIPNTEIGSVDTDDEQTYSLYEESFVQNCRLEHMIMVMALHPQYLQQFLDTNYHLMQSKGVLSFHFRSYIAIMAAARHQCTYLVHLMESHFLLQGGDREWLRGLDHVPAKLRALSTLNKLLAHRPWLVTTKHIKDLVDGESGSRWQHPELAQAIVLLCHFHGLAVFCHGSGTNLEIDHNTAHSFHNTSSSRASSSSPHSSPTSGTSTPGYGRVSPSTTESLIEQTGDVEVLMERMKKLQEEEEEVTREEMNRRFEKEKEEASHEMIPGVNGLPIGGAAYFARYVIDPDFSYQEFAKRDAAAEIPTFREQDYSWSDHACLVVREYYSEVSDLLDLKFNTAYNLTYKTLASKDNVDTTSLRRAIWMYVHCMYGIMYDDYNYGEVNQLLERSLKIFIKTVSCFPEQTTRKIYDGFWKQFRHSEKVHVNIMLMEARMQVGLLYGMRALTEYLKES